MESFKSTKCIGALLHSGFYDKLVLIGFPYDEGSKVSKSRIGSAFAPDCFRRFLHKVGPIQNAEFNADLSQLTMCDYGNITAPSMEACYIKLGAKVKLTLGRGQTAFVIGGTRDYVPFCVSSVLTFTPNLPMPSKLSEKIPEPPVQPEVLHRTLFIGISPIIEANQVITKSDSKSIWRTSLDMAEFSKSGSKLIMFGTGSMCEKESFDYLTSKTGSLIWLKDIRTSAFKSDPKYLAKTQAGQSFEDLLLANEAQFEEIHVSFNMESILVFITS